jgi:hypothetical protein
MNKEIHGAFVGGWVLVHFGPSAALHTLAPQIGY